ncbi:MULTISPECIES: DUF443 family protein [Staphylococcus]|uniref:DUF443 family protein n=1 Tax=Staphylococcus TaxID=1279 RepID=UPI001E5CD664|nr:MULTISPECIES: DUF443 family protein [Staphylococcus]MCI2748845.1 DUF443 family protein [Staphylococcus warneri]MCI2777660.1 DUF443 family protein [Staphylococcus warneri]MCJ1768244.1 DUF443 family protein [Staphylococcus epidermidis]MDU0433540.1 DUF443 family protein [Staphylococcus epidermidis]MDU0447859.1 DUF443 family protein [Staphylococcus epidermidis]
MIDLNRNKLTYIFPLLNYLTRQVLVEIDKDTLDNIRTNHINENKNNALGSIGTGIGVLFATLTKPILDYMNFTTNLLLNIMLVLISIIPLIILKEIIDRKKKKKFEIRMSKNKMSAFVWPNFKEFLKNIIINIILSFIIIALVLGFIIQNQSNYIYILGIMLVLSFILFQNVLLYAQTEITGKIGRIKWKR